MSRAIAGMFDGVFRRFDSFYFVTGGQLSLLCWLDEDRRRRRVFAGLRSFRYNATKLRDCGRLEKIAHGYIGMKVAIYPGNDAAGEQRIAS